MHCPDSGLDKFEEISYLLKQQKEGKIVNLSDFLRITEDRPYSKPSSAQTKELTSKYIQKAKKFFDVSEAISPYRNSVITVNNNLEKIRRASCRRS